MPLWCIDNCGFGSWASNGLKLQGKILSAPNTLGLVSKIILGLKSIWAVLEKSWTMGLNLHSPPPLFTTTPSSPTFPLLALARHRQNNGHLGWVQGNVRDPQGDGKEVKKWRGWLVVQYLWFFYLPMFMVILSSRKDVMLVLLSFSNFFYDFKHPVVCLLYTFEFFSKLKIRKTICQCFFYSFWW